MPHHKKKNKKVKKDSQLVLRVNKDERDAFVELCEDMDTSASREIRRFMKEFILEHADEDEDEDEDETEAVIIPTQEEKDS